MATGPLNGVKVVELAGIGPAPMACMLLADLGAEVLRIDRVATSGLGVETPAEFDLLNRGKRSAAIDLKSPAGRDAVLRLIDQADVLVEGFRPGVAEKLGLGPDVCHGRNPRLVYGRMTGWGQDGPLAHAAGHDMNYIALTGALHAIGHKDGPPVPPLNLVGDFGGGALYLAFGIAAALFEAGRSGQGQVIDAAMVDGAASLMTFFYGLSAMGLWQDTRGVNMLDSGAPYYQPYQTSDGKWVSVAAIEPKFYRELLDRIGLAAEDLPDQNDPSGVAGLRARLEAVFKTKTRDEWCAILEGSDACFAPVLGLSEAPNHPHMRARQTFTTVGNVVQPAAAPRFSRSGQAVQGPPPVAGEHTDVALQDWGFGTADIEALRAAGALGAVTS